MLDVLRVQTWRGEIASYLDHIVDLTTLGPVIVPPAPPKGI
jgi:hypothetical protein